MTDAASTGARVARLTLAALAALCAAVALLGLRADDRCAGVIERTNRLTPASPASEGRELARLVVERCADPGQAGTVAVLLSGSGRRADGLAVARGLVRREPEDYLGWFLLGTLEPDPARSRPALVRARALNPQVATPRGGPGAASP